MKAGLLMGAAAAAAVGGAAWALKGGRSGGPVRVTLEQLRTLAPRLSGEKAALYLPHLNAALAEWSIDSAAQVSAFFGQVLYESNQFNTWMEGADGWDYDPSRNPDKAKKLGNTAVGDGPKYRGMGPIQLTGKYNVAQCGKALKLPLVEEPKRLLLPEVGFRAAGWYWRKGKPTDLNALGAKNTEEAFREITRLVNGAYLGLADRLVYWNRARKLYGVMPA